MFYLGKIMLPQSQYSECSNDSSQDSGFFNETLSNPDFKLELTSIYTQFLKHTH